LDCSASSSRWISCSFSNRAVPVPLSNSFVHFAETSLMFSEPSDSTPHRFYKVTTVNTFRSKKLIPWLQVWISLKRKIKGRPILFWGGLFYQLFVVFAACFLGEGICITGHSATVTTRFTRSWLTKYCSNIHFFLFFFLSSESLQRRHHLVMCI
jgi:hypothetical protein